MKPCLSGAIACLTFLALGCGNAYAQDHSSRSAMRLLFPDAPGWEDPIRTVPVMKSFDTDDGFEYTVNKFAPSGSDSEVIYESIWNDVFVTCAEENGLVQQYMRDRSSAPPGTIHEEATDAAYSTCKRGLPPDADAGGRTEIVIARTLSQWPVHFHRIAVRGKLLDSYKVARKKAYDKCLSRGQRVEAASFSHEPLEQGGYEVNVDFRCDTEAPIRHPVTLEDMSHDTGED